MEIEGKKLSANRFFHPTTSKQAAHTTLRLGKALGTSAQLWLNLQNEFDMRMAKSQIGKELERITPVTGRAAA
jgi:plasmid maintenance system antidote protein VapI